VVAFLALSGAPGFGKKCGVFRPCAWPRFFTAFSASAPSATQTRQAQLTISTLQSIAIASRLDRVATSRGARRLGSRS
jgi:hypothetical protein